MFIIILQPIFLNFFNNFTTIQYVRQIRRQASLLHSYNYLLQFSFRLILTVPRLTEWRPHECNGRLISLWPWLLTCDLERSYLLRSSLGIYNLQRRLRYSHLLTSYCPCSLFQEPISPKHERPTSTLWRHRRSHHNENNYSRITWDGLLISNINFKLW